MTELKVNVADWLGDKITEKKSASEKKDEMSFTVKASDRERLLKDHGVSKDALKIISDVDKAICTEGLKVAGKWLEDDIKATIKDMKKAGKSEDDITEALDKKRSVFKLARHDGITKQTISPSKDFRDPQTEKWGTKYGSVYTSISISKSFDKDALTEIQSNIEKAMSS